MLSWYSKGLSPVIVKLRQIHPVRRNWVLSSYRADRFFLSETKSSISVIGRVGRHGGAAPLVANC